MSTIAGKYRFAAPVAQNYEQWRPLYGRYGESVGDIVDDAIARGVFDWLLDPQHEVEAVFAFEGDRLAGFAHYRPFPRTLHANTAGYLDDLFVSEADRGHGLARALIERVAAVGRQRGWTEVRWVTWPDSEAR
ncbi:MAG: GNAT family N-acetyltransferase, partial [Candidatus Eremiobacteraeota bacterium]|nr:GNAT family N-acetyltransferase [Candidatus Eremiobacteraeota bacterium]